MNCRLVLLGTDSCDELFTLGAGCLRSRSAGTSCLGTWGDFGTLEKPFSAHRYKDIGKRLSQATLAHRVYPGDGEWTRMFSDVVGSKGRVYSFVPAEVAHFKNDPLGRMRALAKEPGRENVEAVSSELVAMPEAMQPADVLWLHLFYHDLHTELAQAKGATAVAFNRAVFDRLKSGGYYVIVDHAAAAGAGTTAAQSLHRIAPASVREEVEAVGFVLDGETAMLAKDTDPHSVKAFEPSIKGETDRFAFRFKKP